MAFYDIISGGVMDFNRTDVPSFIDIVSPTPSIHFPLITGGWGIGGGLAARVIGSPIIKTIRIWN